MRRDSSDLEYQLDGEFAPAPEHQLGDEAGTRSMAPRLDQYTTYTPCRKSICLAEAETLAGQQLLLHACKPVNRQAFRPSTAFTWPPPVVASLPRPKARNDDQSRRQDLLLCIRHRQKVVVGLHDEDNFALLDCDIRPCVIRNEPTRSRAGMRPLRAKLGCSGWSTNKKFTTRLKSRWKPERKNRSDPVVTDN